MRRDFLTYLLLLIAPIFFCSNMLVARATHEVIPPVALAFWRWTFAFLLVLPFTWAPLWRDRKKIRREWGDLIVLGGLGMGICGAFPYIGADSTTATNIGLIMSASPVIIIVLGAAIYKEKVTVIQCLGVVVALSGLVTIVCFGDVGLLIKLRLNRGDLWIFGAAVSWALYSVFLRHRPSKLDLMPRFAAISLSGALTLLPFHLWEAWRGEVPKLDLITVSSIVLVGLVPSFAAYQIYSFLQRSLGAGRTGLMMYLIPIYNSVLARILLGERFQEYHMVGLALILPGLFLAMGRERTIG